MILSFHPCFDADIRIVLGSSSLNASDIDLIRQAHAIILPQGRPEDFYEACSRSDAALFPNYQMRFQYPGKMGQSLLFEDVGCPQPETVCWPTVQAFRRTYPESNPFPFVPPFLIKDDKSHEAEGVYLVEDEASLDAALNRMTLREKSGFYGFVTQAYVPSGGNVLRAVIMGDKIITYWKRPATPGQIITTISKGAAIDHLWQPDMQARGKTAVQTLAEKTGINLAAVDLLFPVLEYDPEPLFLEINYYFGRKGLGGSERYYGRLFQAIRQWLREAGLDPDGVRLI